MSTHLEKSDSAPRSAKLKEKIGREAHRRFQASSRRVRRRWEEIVGEDVFWWSRSIAACSVRPKGLPLTEPAGRIRPRGDPRVRGIPGSGGWDRGNGPGGPSLARTPRAPPRGGGRGP